MKNPSKRCLCEIVGFTAAFSPKGRPKRFMITGASILIFTKLPFS